MVTRRFSAGAVALAAAIVLGVPAAAAGANTDDPEAGGKAEFEKGVRYFRAQEYEAALPHFQKAYELSNRRPSTIRALAQTERALAMYDDALRHFREFLATNPKQSEAVTVRETIALIEELKKDPNAPKPKITEDMETPAIGAAPVEKKKTKAPASDTPSITSQPAAPAADPAPRVERIADPRNYRPEPKPASSTKSMNTELANPMEIGMAIEDDHTVPWIVTGSGAAVAITGAVLFGLGVSDANKVSDAPPGAPFRGEIEDASNRAPALTTAGLSLLAAGVIATGVGIVWMITD